METKTLMQSKLEIFNPNFSYIVHYYDEVKIGRNQEELIKNVDRILELHVFDGNKYICAQRNERTLKFFDPIEYDGSKKWRTKKYKLHPQFTKNQKNNLCLEVRTLIDVDNNLLAYESKKMIVGVMEVSNAEK